MNAFRELLGLAGCLGFLVLVAVFTVAGIAGWDQVPIIKVVAPIVGVYILLVGLFAHDEPKKRRRR